MCLDSLPTSQEQLQKLKLKQPRGMGPLWGLVLPHPRDAHARRRLPRICLDPLLAQEQVQKLKMRQLQKMKPLQRVALQRKMLGWVLLATRAACERVSTIQGMLESCPCQEPRHPA